MTVRTKIKLTGPALIFITTSAKDFSPVFSDPRIADTVTNVFAEAVNYFKLSLVGYILMPTHLHALVGFKKADLLPHFVQSCKILSSKAVKSLVNKSEIRSCLPMVITAYGSLVMMIL